jgi:S-adenosylmethionine-diacylglycerol 3-amino-3-carboxypropyl transferase
MSSSIADRASFDLIRYANCWEDADVLCEALDPSDGKRMLSVASGGDNSLVLLARGAEVIAADISDAQLALVELKLVAIKHLTHAETLRFLGARHSRERMRTYTLLRGALSRSAAAYWDRNLPSVERGVVHCGRFERFLRVFRTAVLPLVHDRRSVESLLSAKSDEGRRAFYDTTWDTFAWRSLFKVFFSRTLMGALGRDPEFFRYVDGPVSSAILGRVSRALRSQHNEANPYLEYILTGTFTRNLPAYLRPENHECIRRNASSLTLYRGDVCSAARACGAGTLDGCNLSDVFEYVDRDEFARMYGCLASASRVGARLAYWNLLVPRTCRSVEGLDAVRMDRLSERLHADDRAFFYTGFNVEEIVQ